MGRPFLCTVTAFVLIALAVKCTYALQVEFFSQHSYVGYQGGVQNDETDDTHCHNIDIIHTRSVKTDACIMLYNNPDCRSWRELDQFNVRVKKNTPKFDADDRLAPWPDYRKVQSFRACGQKSEGGPLLDFDYYNTEYYRGALARKWRNVCTCQNIPENIRAGGDEHPASFANFGNDMEIFSGENCKGDSRFIPAGQNRAALLAVRYEPRFDIASFRPFGLPNCIKLTANIFKFSFKNGTSDLPNMDKVWLAASGDILNNGPAQITKQYTISETVTQTVEYSIATGYTKMHEASVSASVTVEAEAGLPLIGSSKVTASISAGYKYSAESSGSNTNSNSASTATTIQTVQTVTVLGCNNCHVSTYVNQAKNFPIKYDSYSNISGTAGSKRLTAAEVKASLPTGTAYVKDADDYTVVAITSGVMHAEFGLKTFIEADCEKVPKCYPDKLRIEMSEKGSNIGAPMDIGYNWNSLSESSFAF